MSTLEIAVTENAEHTPFIVQHCTFNNLAPSKALQDLEPRLLAYIQHHADWQAVVQWRIQAANTKLYYNVNQAFSLVNLRRLCTALGRERVLGLFVDVAKIRDAVRVYKEQSRVDCGNQVLQST